MRFILRIFLKYFFLLITWIKMGLNRWGSLFCFILGRLIYNSSHRLQTKPCLRIWLWVRKLNRRAIHRSISVPFMLIKLIGRLKWGRIFSHSYVASSCPITIVLILRGKRTEFGVILSRIGIISWRYMPFTWHACSRLIQLKYIIKYIIYFIPKNIIIYSNIFSIVVLKAK